MANGFLQFLPHYFPNFEIRFATTLLKEINQWLYSEAGGYKIKDNI
jgi:hypothetical protein